MNFSIASNYGVFGAIIIVILAVLAISAVLALVYTVFSGPKSIQEVEAEQIESDNAVQADSVSR